MSMPIAGALTDLAINPIPAFSPTHCVLTPSMLTERCARMPGGEPGVLSVRLLRSAGRQGGCRDDHCYSLAGHTGGEAPY